MMLQRIFANNEISPCTFVSLIKLCIINTVYVYICTYICNYYAHSYVSGKYYYGTNHPQFIQCTRATRVLSSCHTRVFFVVWGAV